MAANYYRKDGVRITHDPYAKGMAEKYGMPGKTDNEGFDPYADSVGAGIYGGIVKRGPNGNVLIGRQYQNHNPRPGPVYAGGGYTPINTALHALDAAEKLLQAYPDLVNDVSTGGAQPLHMCGMSQRNQRATHLLIQQGGDIEALDTYGYTPLHRMASNNLAYGASALLAAGADPLSTGGSTDTAMQIALSSGAQDVIRVLKDFGDQRAAVGISKIAVSNSEFKAVNGEYIRTSADEIPTGFDSVCQQQGWVTDKIWAQLNGGQPWFLADNGAYIYFNRSDHHWWIDHPNGDGVYKAPGPEHACPAVGWKLLTSSTDSCNKSDYRPPSIQIYRDLQE